MKATANNSMLTITARDTNGPDFKKAMEVAQLIVKSDSYDIAVVEDQKVIVITAHWMFFAKEQLLEEYRQAKKQVIS